MAVALDTQKYRAVTGHCNYGAFIALSADRSVGAVVAQRSIEISGGES